MDFKLELTAHLSDGMCKTREPGTEHFHHGICTGRLWGALFIAPHAQNGVAKNIQNHKP